MWPCGAETPCAEGLGCPVRWDGCGSAGMVAAMCPLGHCALSVHILSLQANNCV